MPIGINRYYRQDYVPPIILPPRYIDSNQYYFPKLGRMPLHNRTSFCRKFPLCYPCPGWKYMGPPKCI